MNGLVSVDVLNTLYTSVKERLYPKPSPTHILDFLVLIPCRGRRNLLEATLKRFNEENTNVNTAIFLIEHSESPEYKDLAKEHGIGWFYIPLLEDKKIPQGQFNRALCFDIGFLYGYPAKYVLCHDNDLLIPVDFWKKLKDERIYIMIVLFLWFGFLFSIPIVWYRYMLPLKLLTVMLIPFLFKNIKSKDGNKK